MTRSYDLSIFIGREGLPMASMHLTRGKTLPVILTPDEARVLAAIRQRCATKQSDTFTPVVKS